MCRRHAIPPGFRDFKLKTARRAVCGPLLERHGVLHPPVVVPDVLEPQLGIAFHRGSDIAIPAVGFRAEIVLGTENLI